MIKKRGFKNIKSVTKTRNESDVIFCLCLYLLLDHVNSLNISWISVTTTDICTKISLFTWE